MSPTAAPPAWTRVATLQITPIPGAISYLQDAVWIPANAGKPARWVLAQDLKGDTRFLLYNADGTYTGQWMIVKDGGHGSSFHAYRSAGANLYIWTWAHNETEAHRIKWQAGKTVTGGTKMDYRGGRPMSAPEPYIGFRRAGSTTETFSLHSRVGFTDGAGGISAAPISEVTIKKQTARVQQTTSCTRDRIYRLSGHTNQDVGKGVMKHVLEVFTWKGQRLQVVDLTRMFIPSTSDEPEALTWRNGHLVVGKREGGNRPNRSFPLWELRGLA